MKHLFDRKNFTDHLLNIDKLLESGESFAFNRISDGELFMLLGKSIELGDKGAVINNCKVNTQKFFRWDAKSFEPSQDHYVRSELLKALEYSSENYLIGLPCPCCADPRHVNLCRKYSERSISTWANLLLNNNYAHFINVTLNLILSKPVMAAINLESDTTLFSGCPSFELFKIPNGVIQAAESTCQKFLDKCASLQDGTIVLVSASAVAKIMIYKGNQLFPKLTFIDIGTTLNPYLRLGLGRDYLIHFWKKNSPTLYGNRMCYW